MQRIPDLPVRMFLDVQPRHGDTTAAEVLVRRFASGNDCRQTDRLACQVCCCG
jgi:hypothetical protein